MDRQLEALGEGVSTEPHRTLAEKAFVTLRTAIMTGRLRPGVRLPIEDLAEAMQMSPMPIREALRRLDRDGLVDQIPHRGARVAGVSITDLAEVYEARVALELLTIRHAAERFGPADEQRCRAALDELHAAPEEETELYSAAHETFHFALYETAGSRWLVRLIRPVWESSERYWLVLPPRRRPAHRQGEHGRLLDVCAANDADGAERLLRDHLTETANFIAALMGGPVLYPDAPNAGAPPAADVVATAAAGD